MARYGDEMSGDRWGDDDRERSNWRDRGEDRGFFERAGDQLRSWFSDEDDDRAPGRDYQRDTSWNRDQQSNRGSMPRAWDNDQNRSSHGGGWSSRSSWDQNRSGGSQDRNRGYGRESGSSSGGMNQSGFGRPGSSPGSNWDRDQGRGGYGSPPSGGSYLGDRDRGRSGGFGGYRNESDFRGQHHRDHPQSWGEANRGENDSLGYGDLGGTAGGFGNQQFGSDQHDHYRSWRDRQMSQLDQDYRDYCREREQQFHQDFDSWRRNRQSQGPSATSNASSTELGVASNAGAGTTTASMTGTGGTGSAIGSATGTGGSIQADTTGSTETADAGSPTGGGRSGSRSRS